MSANSLHIDLPAEQRLSVVPWIVVLACAAVLLVQISQQLKEIPASLLQQAVQRLDASVYPDVAIAADGRDLQLTGSIDINQSVEPLVATLLEIDGVMSVENSLAVIDPALQAQLDAERFRTALQGIDVSSVTFQTGSVSFTAESDAALSQLLNLLNEHPRARVRIEGHTDNTGPDSVNLRVSRDRAAAVANFLMARGIAADQLIVKGYGSTQPIADNTTEPGRTRNRRIEINTVN